ncbi:MAG: flavin reductase family protein [Acidobacteriota bacterium]|nr:flavin reductase family protein [Acidobacteriota bacterium]
MAHQTIHPSILYFGTPVVLIGTRNEDGTSNLAPISSAWWLGWNCVLGFGAHSKTPQNLRRTRMCTLNLPSVLQVSKVDKLARLTGSDPVPPGKQTKGYTFCADKFGASGFTEDRAELVDAPVVRECPVQMEAELTESHVLTPEIKGSLVALEVRILRVRARAEVLMDGERDRIDPDRWRPLMMSFCRFYGLGEEVHASRLAEIPEALYRPQRVQAMLDELDDEAAEARGLSHKWVKR